MHFSSSWLLLLGVPLLQASDNSGIKMTIQFGNPGPSAQRTIYLQSDRKRMEFRNYLGEKEGPRLVAITRCDLGQMFELNLDTREYTSAPYPPKPFTKEEMQARGLPAKAKYVSDKPTLRIGTTTTDTGEREEIFGPIARHVIVIRRQIPLEGSVSAAQESVTDGWYIDSKTPDSGIDLQRLSCDRQWPERARGHSYGHAGGLNEPMDKVEFVDIGEAETGFALRSVMTSKLTHTLSDGTVKQFEVKSKMQVTDFEEGPLDPTLFEIPSGFKQVDHIERNPSVSAFANQSNFWQRVRASVAGLLR